MLAQQLPDIQHFLKWTSTGEYFNAELCEEVFNISDWEFLLSDVMRQNLFISQQTGGYQYHQLFRTFLQTHFKLKQPNEFKSAHRRLAGWYQSQNKPDRAIEHYIESDSISEAVQLAESLVFAYYAQGRVESILQLSQKLQTYDIPMPNLDHARAQIYLRDELNLEQAQYYANRSLAYFEKHQQLDNAYDVMTTLGTIQQLRGDLLSAKNLFQTILSYASLSTAVKGDALNQLGLTEYYLGDINTAILHLQEALIITEETGGLFNRAKLYQELELVYRDIGNVKQANDCLEKQIHLWRRLNNPEPLAMALNNLGYRYYERGQYSLAEQAYQQGLDSISNLLSTRARYYLLASLGDLQRDQRLYHEARSTYQRALNLIAGKEPYAHSEVLTNLATLYRWQAKYEAALTCANDAIEIAHKHNLQQRHLLAQVAQWHIRLQPWSIRDIQSEIEQLAEQYPRLESDQSVEFMTLQLRIAVLDSKTAEIQTLLRKFTNLNTAGQSIQTFIAELIHNHELSPFWNQIKYQYPQLHTALEQRTVIPPPTQPRIVPLASDTHSLHIYTLGIERIRKNNAHIKIAETYAERVREFLYYFVFMGGGTREEISRLFWEDNQKDNFHQTLARIRSALGNKIILFDEDSDVYELNPNIQLWCDALQLESLVTEARRLSFFNQHAFNLWYQATQLTYGEFLPAFDHDWINQRRRYFHNLSIEAWMGLADCHRQQRDYRSALAAYETIESFAPYHEAAYRGRMECSSILGETALVTSIYKSLEDRLARDLQIQPSQQSIMLYRQLVSSAS
jgi:DNA-binding SARP family transcriptional activator/TolA-binding protein